MTGLGQTRKYARKPALPRLPPPKSLLPNAPAKNNPTGPAALHTRVHALAAPKPHQLHPPRTARALCVAVAGQVRAVSADGHKRRAPHMRKMRWCAGRLVLLHAQQNTPQRSARLLPPPSAPRGFIKRRTTQPARITRAAIGVRLRRSLRGADAFENLCALFRALWLIQRNAAKVAKRLARGLTRLCPLIAAQPPADAITFFAPRSPAAADSS